jgi:hypothetical protein
MQQRRMIGRDVKGFHREGRQAGQILVDVLAGDRSDVRVAGASQVQQRARPDR